MAKTPVPVSSYSPNSGSEPPYSQKMMQSAGYIVGAIVLALAAYFGWGYWQENNVQTDTVAADKYVAIEQRYEALMLADDKQELLALNKDIDQLVAEHGSTVYAWQALMLKAKNATDTGDYKTALSALDQALQTNLNNPGLTAITHLRYVPVLLAMGEVDAALKQVSTDVPQSFEASQQELLGDVFLAKGDREQAIRSYQNAWSMLSKRFEERPILRLKLEGLGIVPEPIKSKPSVVNESQVTKRLAPSTEAIEAQTLATDAQTDSQTQSTDSATQNANDSLSTSTVEVEERVTPMLTNKEQLDSENATANTVTTSETAVE